MDLENTNFQRSKFNKTTGKTGQRVTFFLRKPLTVNVPSFDFVWFCTVLLSDQESRKGDHGNRALLGLIRAEHESAASHRWLQAIPRFQRAGLRF